MQMRCRCVDRRYIHTYIEVWSAVACSAVQLRIHRFLPLLFTFFLFLGGMGEIDKGGICTWMDGCGVGFCQTGIKCREVG